jgi:cell division protein FtsW
MSFARVDQSPIAQWWWTVDRWTLAALLTLIGFGALLVMAASPAVADRIGADNLHFVKRFFAVLPLAVSVLFIVSLQSPRVVRRTAFIGFAIALALLALTFIVGVDIKGARRWINLAGFALQPSEFVKPTFAVVAAWLFAERRSNPRFPGNAISLGLFLLVLGILVKQPDLGMAAVVSAVWLTQFFLAGLRLYWVAVGMGCGAIGVVAAYFALPHVAARIDQFFDRGGDGYQINRSMEAFTNGGLWGRGPGEGTVKGSLPDAHADFVFAVAGEELGLVVCLAIVALFAFVVLRGFTRVIQEPNLFVMLAATGLFVQFGLQAIINMASTLHLMPTKGMTLPFISYGGSSMVAVGLGMGMALALTRRRFGGVEA